MHRALVLLLLLVTACEGSFVRPEDLGRKVAINKSYEARDTCLKHKAADGMASAEPSWLPPPRSPARAKPPGWSRPQTPTATAK